MQKLTGTYYKLIMCIFVYATLATSYNIVKANESNALNEATRVENYISTLYKQIDFATYNRLSYDVFNKAMRGFLSLKNAGKLTNEKEIISICDFNQPSVVERLWVIDLVYKKVLFNTYVAHGQATGDDCAVTFSNKMNSHQSSLGFYATTETYQGEHGLSLRLQGLDQGFNDAAFKRDIVIHGADYVCDGFICENKRLGRSWGCPAVPLEYSDAIINTIKNGTCLFVYYPDVKYLKTAYWLNRKVTFLPDYDLYGDMIPSEINKPRFRTIQYMHNGIVDSVKRIRIEQ